MSQNKYYIIYNDTEFTMIDEFNTIEEAKIKISEIQKDKWLYLDFVIYGKEIENVA